MKSTTFYLLLAALLGITAFLSFAQQNQNTQKPNSEIEALKKRISVLESKLQTVENVEKMELSAKLTEANAKLINTDIDKLKGELRESNNDWLRAWNNWFVGIVSVIAVIIGAALWLVLKTLIGNGIEKRLNGFKEAVDQVNILKNQLKVLQKEHAVSVLGHFRYYHPDHEPDYREQTALLPTEAILQVLSDKTRDLQLRHKAAEVLVDRKSSGLVSPILELLNSFIDDSDIPYGMEAWVRNFVNFVGQMHTEEAYQGLKKFLNRLLNDDTGLNSMLLTQTAVSLAQASGELNKRDSLPILRKTVPDLDVESHEDQALRNLIEHFDRFNEPDGIKDILKNGIADRMPEVETRCLELLEKHNPDFVRDWKAQKETTNIQNEESE